MKHNALKTVTLLALLLLLLSSVVYAQEPAPQATQEAQSPVTVNVPTTPNTAPPTDTSPTGLIVIGLGILATGLIAISLALQVVGHRAQAISDNPISVAALEQGYGSLPDAIKAAIKPIVESLERSDESVKSLIELAHKLTDGVPEASKPPVIAVQEVSTKPMFPDKPVPMPNSITSTPGPYTVTYTTPAEPTAKD